MGLDLTAYLEYKAGEDVVLHSKVFIHRNFTFYPMISGGHSFINPEDIAKGLPRNLSWDVLRDNRDLETDHQSLYEIDDAKALQKNYGYCSRAEAEEHVKQNYMWVKDNHIADTEINSPNWLNVDELERIYQLYLEAEGQPIAAVQATIAAMHELPEARLVLWLW